ncbi:hypothetical protein CLV51_10218 [Chitinophaga niastensis]|uniref:Uncharacterized protein n=1 Tax=Chitinophaga niastensis TaxID=536980 RepID=A0A2P8HLU0_CHINA|nr:hypothetical protein [Chitinophaga niastensis]PSL47173.1 hypothetical protein CLV51_10218 [Chitinophaga niastensis]
MKFIIPVCCLFFLFSCTGPSSQTNNSAVTAVQKDSAAAMPDSGKHVTTTYTSKLRKGETLLKGKTYLDTLQFIDLNTYGDDYLLIAVKGKDTFSFVYNNVDKPIKLDCGDQISIQWNMDIYEPAGDPEYKYPREFIASHTLLKPGKLALLRQQQTLKTSIVCEDNEMTDESKDQIDRAALYYLANSTETAIRDIVGSGKKNIICTVGKRESNEQEVFTVTLATADDQQIFKRLFFNFEKPYTLYE